MKIFRRAIAAATSSLMAASVCIINLGDNSSLGTADAASMTAVQLVEDMGQGWNLGNSFDCTNTWTNPLTPTAIETAWGNPVTTEAMIKEIKKSGFNTVRIPVTWYQMMASDGTPNTEYLARIKAVVDYCIDNGMYAIINTHHDESNWIKSADSATVTKFKTLWTSIANYFKSYDQHLVFEGMNEEDLDNSTMMTLNQAFVDAVRATGGNNSSRLLLVEAQANNTAKLLDSSFSAPTDSANMIAVSCHYYEPSTFCVATTESSWGHRETWGTAADYTTLENDLDKLETKFIKNGIPVIIGEYGVDTSTKGAKDKDSMKAFLKEVATYSLNKTGMCPVLWDMSVDNNGQGDMAYFNRSTLTWYDSDIQAIFVEAANGGTTDTSKTDRLTFSAAEISAVDEKTGNTYWQIDLKPYKEFGVHPETAIVNFTWSNPDNSSEASGDIAVSFNVETSDGTLKYSNIDTAIGINDTVATIDLALDEYNTGWDADGAVSETSTGNIDMDYLKFENWWTWAKTGSVSVSIDSVTVIFDGNVPADGSTDITTTTTVSSTVTTTTTTTTTKETTTAPDDAKGQAYLFGMLGADSCWNIGEVNDDSTTAFVTGDGQYTVEWVPAGGGTDTVEFLAVQINPIGESTFTTDSYPELALTVDEVWIDGVQVTDYTTSDGAVNVRYYDADNPGVSRIYLHDDWGTKTADLPSATTITQSVKVVFTVSGVDAGYSADTVWGDADGDDEVKMNDVVLVMQSISNPDKYGLTGSDDKHIDEDGQYRANVVDPENTGVTVQDALQIQKFLLEIVASLDPTAA